MTDDPKFELIIERLDRLESQLKPEYPTWLSVRQCAEYLSLSESTIRKMVTAGSIPYRRLPTAEGGAIRFNRKQIDLWLLTGDVKPKARTRATFEALL